MQDITNTIGFKNNVFGSNFGNDSFKYAYIVFLLSYFVYLVYHIFFIRGARIDYHKYSISKTIGIYLLTYSKLSTIIICN